MVHDGKINVNGFVSTLKGLELHYTMMRKIDFFVFRIVL